MRAYKVQTKDQLSLHVKQWGDNNSYKGTICIIHGLGEHQGRYEHVAKFYNKNGFQVYSYDQRGHGMSEGKRGHSPGVAYSLNDLERVINTFPKDRLFLYGHSFGGNVLVNFLLKKQPEYVNGAILSAPWLVLATEPSAFELRLAKIMNKIFPSFTQNNKLDSNDLSNVDTTSQSYLEDPLNHNRISVRLFCEFYGAGLWALENSEKLKTKTLLIHGANDAIVSTNGTIQFAEKSMGLAEYRIFDNTKHEAHNDFVQEELFAFTLDWLENQL